MNRHGTVSKIMSLKFKIPQVLRLFHRHLLNFLLWLFALIFTLALVVYQRSTGPTYPVKGKQDIAGELIKYELIRSHGGLEDAKIEIEAPNKTIDGEIKFRLYPSDDEWTVLSMMREGDILVAYLPQQPPAGKLSYEVKLLTDEKEYNLSKKPINIRFKGAVPNYYLIPHIFLMFTAMFLGNRAGLEAMFRRKNTFTITFITVITLFFGGLILGPVVQKYAFGDFWTGWPFGQDLTDNKTLAAFLVWIVALFKVRKNRQHKWWVIIAAIVMILVYSIPHSMFGSELDPTTGEVITGD